MILALRVQTTKKTINKIYEELSIVSLLALNKLT